MRPHYAYLPCLTVSEFDTLVTAARSRHRHRGQVISDTSVTMARAVLLEGVRYIDAARDHDGTLSTQAQQAVRVLLRYQAPQTETRLGSADFTQVQPIAPYYSYLPRLTVAEFDALVATAQTRSVRGGKRLSAKSIAMAQVVLLTGAMYSEAGRAQGITHSGAARVAGRLLRGRAEDPEVAAIGHDPFGRVAMPLNRA
ncbi:hypothetical protein C5615_35595 [Burkholderia cepacia]|uniref:TrfB transcriptional repressor protein domain-containing protein n=1 Tax=Burkholderia cepacia TaxID=292 RepID=A0A2S8I2L9_BURCE|nr:hypothetical protein [Burkholderia cepacia]PQP08991.1 hypothetical protein C5615_35595 [Burkholderia cepacia]HDR9511641.1 hypothetical protein [Burkholderia cepacia]